MKQYLFRKSKALLVLVMSVFMFATCIVGTVKVQAVSGTGNVSFTKYLVMDKDANVPDVTFVYTLLPGQSVGGGNGVLPIYAGIMPGYDQSITASVNFSDAEKHTSVVAGDSIELNEGEPYAKKTVEINMSNINFDRPGIYRYVLTENDNEVDDIINDPDTYFLDVYVVYDTESGNLKIENNFLHKSNETSKVTGLISTYITYDLTLSKTVTGNQGDRNKYFEFSVTLANAIANKDYVVTVSEREVTVDNESKTNLETLEANANGEITGLYYLKNGQSIVINALDNSMTYQIVESSYTDDGYATSYVIDSTTSVNASNTNAKTMNFSNHTVTFTNDKKGTVPTGIINEVGPFILLGVVILGGFVLLIGSRKRRNY